jgi:pimeloyl-ACP methyl ester carboxylesterase
VEGKLYTHTGLQLVQPTIEEGWNLCLFDFVGSGISEGEFISLGFFEAIDLQTVISLVLGKGNSKIHLWGRSMGAATSTSSIHIYSYSLPRTN